MMDVESQLMEHFGKDWKSRLNQLLEQRTMQNAEVQHLMSQDTKTIEEALTNCLTWKKIYEEKYNKLNKMDFAKLESDLQDDVDEADIWSQLYHSRLYNIQVKIEECKNPPKTIMKDFFQEERVEDTEEHMKKRLKDLESRLESAQNTKNKWEGEKKIRQKKMNDEKNEKLRNEAKLMNQASKPSQPNFDIENFQKINKLNDELNKCQKIIQTLEERNISKENDLKSLQLQLLQTQTEIADKYDRNYIVQSENSAELVKSRDNEIKELKEKFEKSNELSESSKTKITTLEQENINYKVKLTELSEKLVSITEENTNLSNELNSLKSRSVSGHFIGAFINYVDQTSNI